MTREEDRQKLLDFMLHKRADRFWANSAIHHIMLNFSNNTYWLTEIRNPKIIIGKYGMVDKFTMDCSINTESKKVKGKLSYTFNAGHKVQIKQIVK